MISIRSRRLAGSSTRSQGFTTTSLSRIARRKITRSGISAFRTVDGECPSPTISSARHLDVTALDVANFHRAEVVADVEVERLAVAAARRRLVPLAGACPDGAGLHPGDQVVGGLVDGRRLGGADRPTPDSVERIGAPRSRDVGGANVQRTRTSQADSLGTCASVT